MSAHGTGLLERAGTVTARGLVSGFAVYLASRVADGFTAELAATVFFAVVFAGLWELIHRLSRRDPYGDE
ncbi:hypothetical protein C477_15830 [Haloterrigena salina JCM 13891]|uniref:Uncharacterized protein n=1 Tax=Haloterrigena salina JCM 13891 TaxID=1227488 RepID=M0BZU4_9EURY|nr:hypothetical protein [Haloterrigena salina]ELZ16516.1 hypothetical protein C477_15830 [Haloterrigena salina JCM 13891]